MLIQRFQTRNVLLAVLCVFLFQNKVNAQIGTTEVAMPKVTKIAVFDSSYNFLGRNNVESYAGQTLFVLPGKYAFYNRPYEKYGGRYFLVDSVENVNWIEWKFYLTDKNDPTIHNVFTYEYKERIKFPFLVVSHFNYLKEKFVGKKVIISDYALYRNYDIVTGDTINIKQWGKRVWECTDITIIKDDITPVVAIVKSGNITAAIPIRKLGLSDEESRNDIKYVYLKSEWDRLVAKYGYTMVNCALETRLKVGMPEQLLLYSYGKPDHINSASYGKQYVYEDGDCVYVKDGKVTGWN